MTRNNQSIEYQHHTQPKHKINKKIKRTNQNNCYHASPQPISGIAGWTRAEKTKISKTDIKTIYKKKEKNYDPRNKNEERERLGFHSENAISQGFILEENGVFRSKIVATERVNVENTTTTATVAAPITICRRTQFRIHPEKQRQTTELGGRPRTTEKKVKSAVKKQSSRRVCDAEQCPNAGRGDRKRGVGDLAEGWGNGEGREDFRWCSAPPIFTHMSSFFIFLSF